MRMRAEQLCALVVLRIHSVLGSHTSNQTSLYSHGSLSDPYLQFQPNFSRSLPIQILIAGIVLTLTTTLLIQLLFTWQYHWPLARINWILQSTGVCTLLLNIMAILYVVLSALAEKSKHWPYMFEYVAIEVPRVEAWSVAEVAAWYAMEATTSVLVQITHIQFLTFLYPSRLEARLVFLLLGPLAIVSSIMTLLPISIYCYSPDSNSTTYNSMFQPDNSSIDANTEPSRQQQLLDIFDAGRNICNLTLSLLFTLSLLIWGFLVNRHSAWRTDGGTAAFGAGALFLALVSTGINFINVLSTSRFEWLDSLLWSVVLWQSFLGWWWWVGSASGIAAREFDMKRRGRKEHKLTKRKRRKVTENEDDPLPAPTSGTAGRLERWRSSVGTTLARRRVPAHTPLQASHSPTSTVQGEAIELSTISSTPSDRPALARGNTTSPSTSSVATRASWYPTHFFSRAWHALRQAHVRAARVQAIEHRQIQIQMELENGRGLGRFPGGIGSERRGDAGPGQWEGVAGEEDDVQAAKMESRRVEQQVREEVASSAIWWRGPLRKWRLRDSTMY